jgi:plasmid stabilization system protein ParE
MTCAFESASQFGKSQEYKVFFSPRARRQLIELYNYIANASYPSRAERYVAGLIDSCDRLAILPHRGMRRDDIRSGVRVTHYRRRTVIAFVVLEKSVDILGIFHGGRDYAAILS